ncbi:hypothetical protein [Streptomyces decoyicus]|uniref:hypothetical protein n=1 Tax=Streptomyces decoyicus TaxID=249567 RepID=UPI0033A69A21
MTPEAIAVVIPAHNEQTLLPRALAAVTAAARHPALAVQQRLTRPGELGPDVDHVVVACHDARALLDAGVPTLAFLNQAPWRRFHLPTGHWPMLSAPVELAATLDAVVSSGRSGS